MFVLSVLEAPNTKTNSFVCANTLGNKALSDSDSDISQFWLYDPQLWVYITQFWLYFSEKKSELRVCIMQLWEKK